MTATYTEHILFVLIPFLCLLYWLNGMEVVFEEQDAYKRQRRPQYPVIAILIIVAFIISGIFTPMIKYINYWIFKF